MKKTWMVFLSLLMGLLFPIQAFGDTVKTISFDDIEWLMNSKSPLISNNYSAYVNAKKAQIDGVAAMDLLLAKWATVNYDPGDGANPKDEAAIIYLLEAQKAALEQQKGSFNAMNPTNTLLNVNKGNNTLIWNMEMLYISYNAISKQLEDLMGKKAIVTKQVQIVSLQKKLGMATQIGVSDTENALAELELNIQKLNESKESIVQTFNVNLGQDYNSELEIKEVPDITEDQIKGIDVEKDYSEAKGLSYDMLLDSNSADSEKKFKNNFYRTYQTIFDKQKALDVELKKMTVAESKWKIAQLKCKLGIISSIQYDSEKSTYLAQNTSTEIAKDTLTQAYYQYLWAKRGLIVSSGSGI